MGQNNAWKVVESDRNQEIADLLISGKDEQSQTASEDGALPNLPLPDVNYLVVGEMDGFDLVMADMPVMIEDGGQKTEAPVTARRRIAFSRISIRVVDVANKRWLVQKTINFQEPVQDRANAETQINTALSAMASAIVGEIQLAVAGMPMVAAVNSDGTLLLNRGSLHGVRTGQQWSLSRSETPVKDPETGKILSNPGRIIGQLKIVRIQQDSFIADFKGTESAKVGDKGLLKRSEDQRQEESGPQSIRIAIGGFVLGPEVDPSIAGTGFFSEFESRLMHSFQRDSGMKVVEQNSGNIKKLLAQQMLTDLSKGREPGLPMGTLSGVDYLLFGKIYKLYMTVPQDLKVDAIGETVKGGIPASGIVRAHIYLQDVNTGELSLSEQISINERLDGKTPANAKADLLTVFVEKSMSKVLTTIRPLSVDWVDKDMIGINHGQSIGLKIGDILEAFTRGEVKKDPTTGRLRRGIGARAVARVDIIGFSPDGWAEARLSETLIEGKELKYGMRLKRIGDAPQGIKKKEQDTKLNW